MCCESVKGERTKGLEERMQSANKAWWRDVKFYRSKDVPWRIKCRRMVEHVCGVSAAVFAQARKLSRELLFV